MVRAIKMRAVPAAPAQPRLSPNRRYDRTAPDTGCRYIRKLASDTGIIFRALFQRE
jgi:hypothetical protein